MFGLVTRRSRTSIGRVLEDVGSTLLDLVLGEPDRAKTIGVGRYP